MGWLDRFDAAEAENILSHQSVAGCSKPIGNTKAGYPLLRLNVPFTRQEFVQSRGVFRPIAEGKTRQKRAVDEGLSRAGMAPHQLG